MKFEFAPLEGVTGWPLRLAHAECFPGIDRYYSPFIAANSTKTMKTREKKDVDPAHTNGMELVPQILTNNAEAFLWTAARLKSIGYNEVNLNLGCPSGTVVTHGKGAGFLSEPARLDAFFENVFARRNEHPDLYPELFTVKTRIGLEDPAEMPAIIDVLNRHPIDRVIVHPRLRSDFYKGTPRMEEFRVFAERSVHPLTYNGNLMSLSDIRQFETDYPEIDTVMIGRGLLMNPALVREAKGGAPLSKAELRTYHDRVVELWWEDMGDFHNVLGKMKELWFYMGPLFEHSEKLLKKVRKARREDEYRAAVNILFSSAELLPPEKRLWRP